MSKSATAPEAVPSSPSRPEPPPGVELSYIPNLLQPEGAARFAREQLGIPLTAATIKKAVIKRELPRTILLNKMWISSADLWDWLMARRGYSSDDSAVRS